MKHPGYCLAAALICHGAGADMQLTMAEKHKDSMQEASATTVSIRNGKVLFEAAAGTDDFAAIYDAETGSITQIDHSQKAYIVMDRQTMSDTAKQMSAMMKQVEAQLANLPKEQRDAMMKSMPSLAAGMGQKPEPAAVEIEWTGDKDRVAGYPCKVAVVKEGDKPTGVACIARPKDLGMSDEDFEALASMFETMAEFADTMSGESGMPDMREIGGFPISTSDPENGSSSTLTKASDASLDDALFEIPAGYRQQSMAMP